MASTKTVVASDQEVQLTIKQGTLLSFGLTVKRKSGSTVDLTNFTGRGEVRRLKDKVSELLGTFSVAIVSVTASQLVLAVRLGATITKGITTPGFFDIEIEDTVTPEPDDVFRVLQGPTVLDTEVTAV